MKRLGLVGILFADSSSDQQISKSLEPRLHTTVVMINRNGGAFLREALRSCVCELNSSRPSRQDFDLLVVDNGSTDDSLSVIADELARTEFPWRLVQEHLPGVNSARNAGLRESVADLLIFVDSDLQFQPGWLEAYLEAADKYPEIEVFAGKVRVGLVEGPVPDWLDLTGPWKRSCIVVQADLGDELKVLPLTPECGPVGPSMAFRRSIFEKVGIFDTQFGLRPGSLVAGAEAEFFDRLSRRGVSFCWVPGAVVDHPVKRQQMTRQYFLSRLHGVGRVTARIAWMRGDRAKRLFGLTLYRLAELMPISGKWLLALQGGSAREAFYHRGQISILLGHLHEDFLRWKENRRAKGQPS